MKKEESWTKVCKDLIDKFYQLNLKVMENPNITSDREYGYTSMSAGKYTEGFKSNANLYTHTIEFANDLLREESDAPEEKLDSIIRETRTLVRNDIPYKTIATFLNTCLKISNISPKFYFTPSEIERIRFDDKYDDSNNAIVASWMENILLEEYNK